MPTAYSTLQFSRQNIYRELQSKLDMFQPSCEFQGVSFETISEIYKAVLEDHPEYFWLSGASSGTTKSSGAFSSNEIRLSHRFSQNQFIPSPAGTRYDYYRYHGLYAERYSYDVVKAIAQKQLTRGNKFSVKFGSQTQLNTALHDLMDNQRIFSIPGVSSRISYGKS